MLMAPPTRVVIDTNIVFEGLTKREGAPGEIIEAWRHNLLQPCISAALAYEYVDVLARKLSPQRWRMLKPVIGALLHKSEFTLVYYTWRPMSPDPNDDHVIDCALNAGAIVVTANVRDFRLAQQALGLEVMRPNAYLELLSDYTDNQDV